MTTDLAARYERVRQRTVDLCKPLTIEDFVVQSMSDASPTKWHLAHTTWFFETFVLKAFVPEYRSLNDTYSFLFNSYYVQAGARYVRDRRGLISRPSVQEVFDYRNYVNSHMMEFLSTSVSKEAEYVIEVGINHEQQHQELLVTDIKHVLFANPLFPKYDTSPHPKSALTPEFRWVEFEEGITSIGHASIGHTASGFSYDNESPVHRQFLERFALANRPVSNREMLDFIKDGGYENPLHWLSEGWALCQNEHWRYPFYWIEEDGEWFEFTLYGKIPLDLNAPATHVSYYEADAYARWAGYRLPTEFEWEHASRRAEQETGHYSDRFQFYPIFEDSELPTDLIHMFGSSWEWTNSHYSPYPGYRAVEGALGEYNGKFMANQFVLRGGSCATPSDHIRSTYRNFFPASARWQFSSFRLANRLSQ